MSNSGDMIPCLFWRYLVILTMFLNGTFKDNLIASLNAEKIWKVAFELTEESACKHTAGGFRRRVRWRISVEVVRIGRWCVHLRGSVNIISKTGYRMPYSKAV